MAYTETTWSSYTPRRSRARSRHDHEDRYIERRDVRGGGGYERGGRGYRDRDESPREITAVWPKGQAEAFFLLTIVTAAVLIGLFANLMDIQQKMQLGVPWLFPFAITTGSLTIFLIALLSWFSKNQTLTPQLLLLLSFIMFVLYLTGLIETGLLLFGAGQVSNSCKAAQATGIRGVSVNTLAWIAQNNICSCWYAAFAFWIVGMIAFLFLWFLAFRVASIK